MAIRRRTFLMTSGLVTLAGCLGQAGDEGASTPTPEPEDTPTSTPEPKDTPEPEDTPTSTPEPEKTRADNIPNPELLEINVPNEVVVGESFNITILAQNKGVRAGNWSTITTSFPSFDSPHDSQQLSVVQEDFDAWSGTIAAGSEIVDKAGNRIPAKYAIAEAGTNADTYWEAGKEHRLGVEVTPDETGTFVVYIRSTLTAENNTSKKYNYPPEDQADAVDQQGFPVQQVQIGVNE